MKILIFEDEPSQIQLVKHTLSNLCDCETHAASSLREGMAYLAKEPFDVILLDLNLPDSRGLDALQNILQMQVDTPIVVMSQIHDENLALEAVKQGAQDFVFKDQVFGEQLNGKILLGRLQYAIERHEKKKDMEYRLEKIIYIDPLTGILNRKGMQQALLRDVHFSSRSTASALVIDLDDFEEINVAFGHAVGDVVLKEASKVIREIARGTDHVARVSGDEFMILAVDTEVSDACRIAERLRLSIFDVPFMLTEGRTARLTASIAVMPISYKHASINEILEEAHRLLRKSKDGGKNRTVSNVNFDGGKESVPDAIEKLRSGKYFHTLKQPIFELKTESVVGFEFLSRSSIDGFESPYHFFNLSMEANILNLVDHHCLNSAIGYSFSVEPKMCRHLNLFPSSLINMPAGVLDKLFPPSNLAGSYCIEISEQQILNPAYLVDAVKSLKKRNVKIAIDDVGFGRSCLESLVMLEPEIVKIDKKMVMGAHSDKDKQNALKRLITVLTALDAEMVAEGIENREDMDLVRSLGVTQGQGFLWGQPA